MSNLTPVPLGVVPEAVLLHEPALYEVFYRIAKEGVTLTIAIEGLPISKGKLRYWRKEHSAWITALKERATADALTLRREELLALTRAKTAVELDLQRAILDAAPAIVERAIADAQDDRNIRDRLRAMEAIRGWLKDGFGIEPPTVSEEEKPPALAFNPHIGPDVAIRPVRAVVTYEDGTQVEVTAPQDAVEGEVIDHAEAKIATA